MQKYYLVFILLATTILLYLPILKDTNFFLNRGNDLQEFFWPLFYYVRQQVLEHHTFPLWNNLILSGTPLLPDPQSPLYYPPNIIFLLLPTDPAFIVSFMLHSLFAAIGAYLVARIGFNFSKIASAVTAILYLVFPRTAGFLEAGHFGLVATTTWLPLTLLAVLKLLQKPNLSWSILLAISLAGLFFSHPTTFFVSFMLVSTLLIVSGVYFLKKRSVQTLVFSSAGILLSLGLVAINLLPQLEWLPQTTRFMLIHDRDVYPKWTSKLEFIQALYPQLFDKTLIDTLDTEKWIALGFFISIFAFWGFIYLSRKMKLLIIGALCLTILVTLNNASPVYSLLISSDWFVMGRVSTRIWFIVVLIIVFLAGRGFDAMRKKTHSLTIIILTILAIGELLLLSWLRLDKSIPPLKDYASQSVYEFLKSDLDKFRVFCTNRCLSQKDIAKYGIESVEGYSTLQQTNYFNQFIQLSQVFWNRYTLSLPPSEIYNFREIQPYSPELADYNVKYIISQYHLNDKNLVFQKQIGNYLVYKNSIVKTRAYFSNGATATIVTYSPNYIKIDTSNHPTNTLIISEVYNPGWKAILNGDKQAKITQTPNKLRQVELNTDTKQVELYYLPANYQIGKIITLITLSTITILSFFLLRRQKNPQRTRK